LIEAGAAVAIEGIPGCAHHVSEFDKDRIKLFSRRKFIHHDQPSSPFIYKQNMRPGLVGIKGIKEFWLSGLSSGHFAGR
jgi:hypothetical protein